MSDWKKRNEDWRDEDELEEEEECECPWVDSKGKVRETAYCQYLLIQVYAVRTSSGKTKSFTPFLSEIGRAHV